MELDAQIQATQKLNRVKPKEADFKGKKGYRETFDENGKRSWRYRFPVNEHGKMTKEAREVGEMFAPLARVEAELGATNKSPKAVMKDKDGNVQFVDPGLADATARRNGWTHSWRAGGNRVEVGIDGMLFMHWSHGWEPMGRWCQTTPHDWSKPPKNGRKDGTMRCTGTQRDPSGDLWEAVKGEWVRL